MTTQAILLVGGLGTRLKSVVNDRPKPMALVQGRPFLEWILSYWVSQGIRDFVLTLAHQGTQISDHFGQKIGQASLHYSWEQSPLGTGGGLFKALEKLPRPEEPFFVINGDTFFAVEAQRFEQMAAEHGPDALVLGLRHVPDNPRYGEVKQDSVTGRVLEFSDRSSRPSEPQWINGGVYHFGNPSAWLKQSQVQVKDQVVSIEKDLIPGWIRNGVSVYSLRCPGAFIDIGTPEDFAMAQKFVFNGE